MEISIEVRFGKSRSGESRMAPVRIVTEDVELLGLFFENGNRIGVSGIGQWGSVASR